MEDADQQPLERYALVSSLYGQGTIACWYLTILSVLISWTLHPKKRKSGSIDVDLIAILTLPAVASGHLISQVSQLMHNHNQSPDLMIRNTQNVQVINAIEAPFTVIESFMTICVILFLLAIWMFCLRRAMVVGLVGLLCFATECYIHFSNFGELGIRYKSWGSASDEIPTFGRSFVADFAGLVIAILAILGFCTITASAIIAYMLNSQKTAQEIVRAEQGRSRTNQEGSREAVETSRSTSEIKSLHRAQVVSRLTQLGEMQRRNEMDQRDFTAMRSITWISTIFLPITVLLTAIPSAGNALYFSHSLHAAAGTGTTIWSRLAVFAEHFYPRSNILISDLDQAVTTAAGATILGFSIYSAAKACYNTKLSEQVMQVEENEIELDRVGQD